MSLTTTQLVKILQLKGIGRKTAHEIYNFTFTFSAANNKELIDIVKSYFESKSTYKILPFTELEMFQAFENGDRIVDESETANVKIISQFDNHFPSSLLSIPDTPILLSFKGDFKKINEKIGVAIIGTREPTIEGFQSGFYFGKHFGRLGFNVVSGLAKGCDTSAHEGCLEAGGYTTGILGHGLQMIYPKENRKLAFEIVESGGVLLSEYLYGTIPRPNFFVERDRLQSGLSSGTIVVQTDIKGGTMHAVNSTLKAGKRLAAIKFKKELISDKIRGNQLLIGSGEAFGLSSTNVDEFVEFLSNTKNWPINEDPFKIYDTKVEPQNQSDVEVSQDRGLIQPQTIFIPSTLPKAKRIKKKKDLPPEIQFPPNE
jgi:DNA processing protein